MYAVRTLRKALIREKQLPNYLFGWISAVLAVSDREVLELSGLDAYVVLAFFKMGIKVFLLLLIVAIFVLSPIRFYFTGNYDKDSKLGFYYSGLEAFAFTGSEKPPLDEDFPKYLWLYPIFTYLFSIIVYVELFQCTKTIIRTRQKYLASQNSITDRTIKLEGIPEKIVNRNDPSILKNFIEDLGLGRVVDVKLNYDWTPLENMFARRSRLITQLEKLYSQYFDLNVDLYNQSKLPRVVPVNAQHLLTNPKSSKARLKPKINALSQELVELDSDIRKIQCKFDHRLSTFPIGEDSEIRPLPSAFITMDSVASAQMAAQTVLDPRVYKLLVTLAPAAKDINWNNLKLSYYEKVFKSYLITFVIILSYSVIFFLVTSLSSLLDLKTITKFWPALGHLIAKSKWLSTFVTGILPPALFSLMNVSFPYLYRSLSLSQGYGLSSEVELSTLLKNFFFIFFILFLVFTITGTLWDFFTSIGDTTKFASQLASSLKKLSLFYVDYILLQGLAMFPVKLLQIGDFVVLNIVEKLCFFKVILFRTPRDYRFFYYTPPVFDFGLQLPQHILIFIVILIYSVVSTKIVASGLVYFLLGYFAYKYQLIYSYVHAPHSTGKVWPMIFRRLIFGIVIFQLFMCGTLALEGAILLSVFCMPLFLVTLVVAWNFERFYVPLHSFIALRAILNPMDYNKEFDDDMLLKDSALNSVENANTDGIGESQTVSSPPNLMVSDTVSLDTCPSESSLLLDGDHSLSYRHPAPSAPVRKVSTIDEEREQFTDYTYPRLADPLDGPWIGFEGNDILMMENKNSRKYHTPNFLEVDHSSGSANVDSTGNYVLRKHIQVAEWE